MRPFKFGLIADTQYADRPLNIGRYYRNALKKTEYCMEAFQKEEVNFCVHLGDIIDWPNQIDNGCKALETILPVLNRLDTPMYYVIGNHDLASVPCDVIQKYLHMENYQTWYSFDYEGIHFVTLDCNFDSNEKWYRPDNSEWDQCYIPTKELAWLKNDLHKTNAQTVVVFVHALLDDFDNPHVIRNADAVRAILESSHKQIIVFQGHMHCGHESETNGIGYHTIRSIVDGRTRICYWIVEVTDDEMIIIRHDTTINDGKAKRQTVLKFRR